MVTFFIDPRPNETLLKKMVGEIVRAGDGLEELVKNPVCLIETVMSQEYDWLSKQNENIFKY